MESTRSYWQEAATRLEAEKARAAAHAERRARYETAMRVASTQAERDAIADAYLSGRFA